MLRSVVLLLSLFCSLSLTAQVSLAIEQGATLSNGVTKHRPFGFALDYEMPSVREVRFSLGLALDQVKLDTELNLLPNVVVCPNASFFCNFLPADLEANELRLFIPLTMSWHKGPVTVGFQARPGWRIQNNLQLRYPVLFTPVENAFATVETSYGESTPRSEISSNGSYRVNNDPFRIQLGGFMSYRVSKRLDLGLHYRYEGFVNNEITVGLTDVLTNTPPSEEGRIFFSGERRVVYFLASCRWTFGYVGD